MHFTIPNYYKKFACIGSSCPDTCCAGWQIMIDERSLKRYKRLRGPFRKQLHRGIDFQSNMFRQQDGRCAFLNQDQLCDIYSSVGKKMLCDTCRKYPRHIEEFEGLREISLSLSCPEAARIILTQAAPVSFKSFEQKNQEEEFDDFDLFLFTILMDSREYLFDIFQDRDISIEWRMAKALAYVYDIQCCIYKGELFKAEEIRDRHKSSGYDEKFKKKCRQHTADTQSMYKLIPVMWNTILPQMEILNPDWLPFLNKHTSLIYSMSEQDYMNAHRRFRESKPASAIEYEQLLVYWVFTYFCGAVYDDNPFSKIQMAIVNTLLIRELNLAQYLQQNETFTKEDQITICSKYSRELEHSDENLNKMEELLSKKATFSLKNILKSIHIDESPSIL